MIKWKGKTLIEFTAVAPSPLTGAWKSFWHVVLDPWILFLLVPVVYLLVMKQGQWSEEIKGLIELLLAVSSGVLGGRVANRIGAATEEGILVARGKVAVRGLKLLYQQCSALEARVREFLSRRDLMETNPETTVRGLEEIIAACRQLEQHALSSIDNWTDIVPEAGKIADTIGAASDADAREAEARAELAGLKQQLAAEVMQGKAREEQAKEMEKRVAGAEKRVQEAESEARQANIKLLNQLAKPTVFSANPSASLGYPTITPAGVAPYESFRISPMPTIDIWKNNGL